MSRVRRSDAQLALPLAPAGEAGAPEEAARVDAPAVSPADPVFVRRRGTRRYVLRVLDDGSLRVTIPWWGTQREARRFVETQRPWIAAKQAAAAARRPAPWRPGRLVAIDGVERPIVLDDGGAARIDDAVVSRRPGDGGALRSDVHAWLRRRARRLLPAELLTLAARHDLTVAAVSIRNQRSRWGSCSRRGAISLNWRLVQVPPWVREYVLIHELMHRRQMNHSSRFWTLVADACPRYLEARTWLRTGGASLFD
ncbi:MAG: SprT family zinc-dependent metalloprotease [Vicinamibacterales bacterium]